MARYTKSNYRVSRRLGFSILENGKELARKPYAPGSNSTKRPKKLSNYGVQLQEKQKVRFMYGLNEKQFKKTFTDAGKMKGVHGENLFKLPEFATFIFKKKFTKAYFLSLFLLFFFNFVL